MKQTNQPKETLDASALRFPLKEVIYFCTVIAAFTIQQHRLESKLSNLIANLVTKQEVMETRLQFLERSTQDVTNDQKDMQSMIDLVFARIPDGPSFRNYPTKRRRQ